MLNVNRGSRGWLCAGLPMFVALVLSAGCGGPTTGTVTGRVTYKERPVASGQISFIGPDGVPVCAPIENGSYRAQGVSTGFVLITVVDLPPDSQRVGPPRREISKGADGRPVVGP